MLRISFFLMAALVVAGPQTAGAQNRAAPPQFIGPVPPLDAAGCYFYRGRQWCGRYCYYEANGKRYCQRWKRDAVPQAPLELYLMDPGFK